VPQRRDRPVRPAAWQRTFAGCAGEDGVVGPDSRATDCAIVRTIGWPALRNRIAASVAIEKAMRVMRRCAS
jgi:hypothetical protein